MKKFIIVLCLAAGICFIVFKNKVNQHIPENVMRFGVSAEYPPFEYMEYRELKGFDIDLARLVAQELGKEAVFEDMQFSSILPAVQMDGIDAAISTITITPERSQSFDFSDGYYSESISVVYSQQAPVTELQGKRIACQLGSSLEIWLKKHCPSCDIVVVDNNNIAIEALKVGHVDGVLVDTVQARLFSEKNPGLSYAFVAQSDTQYAIAVKKGSPLRESINAALKVLNQNGELARLQKLWLGADA